MSVERYADDFRLTMKLTEPMMPLCYLAALGSAIVYACSSGPSARLFVELAAALLVAIIIGSGAFTGRINLLFMQASAGHPPPRVPSGIAASGLASTLCERAPQSPRW